MADGIDDLREKAERLVGMLVVPEPGLTTWRMALGRLIAEIDEYGGRGPCTCRGGA